MSTGDIGLAAGTLATLREVSTATITSQLIKQAKMRTRSVLGARPLDAGRCKMVGPVVTVRYAPFREDMDPVASISHPANPMTHAIETSAPGSVLVIDMGGCLAGGALGDVLVARLVARGIAGVVADGAMRDIAAVIGLGMPVFCGGAVASPSAAALLAVETGGAIGCGGVLVYQGDIAVGDGDGVVIIPRHLADSVATAGLEQERAEAWIRSRIEAGEALAGLYPPSEAIMAEWRARRDG